MRISRLLLAPVVGLLLAGALGGCGDDNETTATAQDRGADAQRPDTPVSSDDPPPGNGGVPANNPPGHACTEIGCSSGLTLDLSRIPRAYPDARRIRICVDDRCRTYRAQIAFVELRLGGLEENQQVKAILTVLDAQGKVLHRTQKSARVIKAQPNGPGCPPICFQIPLRLGRGLALVSSRQ